MKKLLSVLLAAVMLFSMFSTVSVVTLAADGNTPVVTEEKTEFGIFDGILDFFSDIISSILDFFTFEKELPDVSEWTDEEIIEYYKKAARKTKYKKADREFVEKEYSVNFIEPKDYSNDSPYFDIFMDSYSETYYGELNSKQVKNIMGDYKKLTVDDCKSIKTYTEGDYTVIELKFKNQHDSINDEEDVITVSHGMLDCGKVDPTLEKTMSIFGMRYTLPYFVSDYSNATAKVRINSRGVVEYGTWYYDVLSVGKNITVTMFGINEKFVCDISTDVSCTMTLGGGF